VDLVLSEAAAEATLGSAVNRLRLRKAAAKVFNGVPNSWAAV